jgi:hypothetical protein
MQDAHQRLMLQSGSNRVIGPSNATLPARRWVAGRTRARSARGAYLAARRVPGRSDSTMTLPSAARAGDDDGIR